MNNSSPDMPMDMPPMDMPQDMGNDMGGNFMPQGDMGGNPMDDGMQGMPNQFDTNFDAGVEASEDEDPKKYIQQLTGKLSQSLRKYNENNGQPDVDLNKYVAGMIVKQAIDGLTQEDADDIIDKVKSDEDFETGDEGGQDNAQPMNQPQQQEQMPMDNNMQQMNENFQTKQNRQIKEIVNGVLDNFKNDDEMLKQTKTDRGKINFRKKPFTAGNFEK